MTKRNTKSQTKMQSSAPQLLTNEERYRLMSYTAMAMSTVLRWERGEGMRPSTRKTLERAARKLSIKTPITHSGVRLTATSPE